MSTASRRLGPGELLAVGLLVAIGAALRWWHLDAGWFGVDQARDIQTALDIAAGHDWPTVGPTMRRLTSLGALYHYMWALPHLVSADPMAAYAFAAGLGTLTMLAVWGFARRFWGRRAALVALAVLATSPVAVIDGRVAWAPAALPIVATVLLWILVGAPTTVRLAVLGAVLGAAVQLHLAMAAWAVAALVLVVARRPGGSRLAAGALGFAATGWPAIYAALANAGHDAGLTTLPNRGPIPDVVARLLAVPAIGWRVPTSFWQWPDEPEVWPVAVRLAAALLAATTFLGILRLGVAATRRTWPAVVVLTVLVCQVAMVTALPGDAWYYYLDAVLPLWALAAGACWLRGDSDASGDARGATFAAAAVITLVAVLLGGQRALWISACARHGYLAVHPAALTLDGAGGRDAAAPGRLLTVATKRAIATELGTEPADITTRWLATHGPAFDDVTGDNGFWLRRVSSATAPSGSALRHATLWYRDDPTAPSVPAPGFSIDAIGPIVIARYQPAVLYGTCQDERGPVRVPIRVVPHPRRYGDGTIARATDVPRRVECMVAAGTGGVRVVATMTSGTVTLRDATGASGTSGRASSLCVQRGERPVSLTIDIALAPNTASDLDLYEQPDPTCADKIAP